MNRAWEAAGSLCLVVACALVAYGGLTSFDVRSISADLGEAPSPQLAYIRHRDSTGQLNNRLKRLEQENSRNDDETRSQVEAIRRELDVRSRHTGWLDYCFDNYDKIVGTIAALLGLYFAWRTYALTKMSLQPSSNGNKP